MLINILSIKPKEIMRAVFINGDSIFTANGFLSIYYVVSKIYCN